MYGYNWGSYRLRNFHGNYLVAEGGDNVQGHHDPSHGPHHASHWRIEPHGGFSDKVKLQGHHGKFLSHDGHHVRVHHDPNHHDTAWHMEQHGNHVAFRSHHGHYLGIEGHSVNAYNHDHPHDKNKFILENA